MITLLFALPRCGSLALSAIMQNNKCDTCHEGQHQDITKGRLVDTEFFKLAENARKAGRNFFCCDTTLAPFYAMMLLDDASSHFGHVPPFKVIYVQRDPLLCAMSASVVLPEFNVQDLVKLFVEREHSNLEIVRRMSGLGIPVTIIPKKSVKFHPAQLEYMANFVGAVDPADMNDRQEIVKIMKAADIHYSMTTEQLREGSKEYTKAVASIELKQLADLQESHLN